MATSRPTSLDYKVLVATEADCASIAKIEAISNCEASKTNPKNNISLVLFGPPDDASFRTKDLANKIQNDKSAHIWKAVITDADGQEKIIAFTLWHFYLEPKVIDDWKDIEWPSTANQEGCNLFLRSTVAMRKKHMSGKIFGRE
jgi:hypothetical protein